MAVEVANIYAVALVGRGLLVEAVVVPRPYAAHEPFYLHLFAEIIRRVYSEPVPRSTIVHAYGVFSKCEGGGLPPHTPFPVSSDVQIRAPLLLA
jgi:hypothetical protein